MSILEPVERLGLLDFALFYYIPQTGYVVGFRESRDMMRSGELSVLGQGSTLSAAGTHPTEHQSR
jgi:hypothetical protein